MRKALAHRVARTTMTLLTRRSSRHQGTLMFSGLFRQLCWKRQRSHWTRAASTQHVFIGSEARNLTWALQGEHRALPLAVAAPWQGLTLIKRKQAHAVYAPAARAARNHAIIVDHNPQPAGAATWSWPSKREEEVARALLCDPMSGLMLTSRRVGTRIFYIDYAGQCSDGKPQRVNHLCGPPWNSQEANDHLASG